VSSGTTSGSLALLGSQSNIGLAIYARYWAWWVHSASLPPDFSELANAIEPVQAMKHLSYSACRNDLAFGIPKHPIMRLWGLIAQRSWARLVLDRLDALAHGSAATTHINAAGHVDDAAEHFKFLYAAVVHEFLWHMLQCVSCCGLILK
jgi:hypothetical protein